MPSQHVVLRDLGKFIGCLRPVPSPTTLAFDTKWQSRHFRHPPPSDSRGGYHFAALLRFACATTCRVARPPCRSWPGFHPANEDFYSRASDGLVTRSAAGYNYGGNWASSTGGTFTR